MLATNARSCSHTVGVPLQSHLVERSSSRPDQDSRGWALHTSFLGNSNDNGNGNGSRMGGSRPFLGTISILDRLEEAGPAGAAEASAAEKDRIRTGAGRNLMGGQWKCIEYLRDITYPVGHRRSRAAAEEGSHGRTRPERTCLGEHRPWGNHQGQGHHTELELHSRLLVRHIHRHHHDRNRRRHGGRYPKPCRRGWFVRRTYGRSGPSR